MRLLAAARFEGLLVLWLLGALLRFDLIKIIGEVKKFASVVDYLENLVDLAPGPLDVFLVLIGRLQLVNFVSQVAEDCKVLRKELARGAKAGYDDLFGGDAQFFFGDDEFLVVVDLVSVGVEALEESVFQVDIRLRLAFVGTIFIIVFFDEVHPFDVFYGHVDPANLVVLLLLFVVLALHKVHILEGRELFDRLELHGLVEVEHLGLGLSFLVALVLCSEFDCFVDVRIQIFQGLTVLILLLVFLEDPSEVFVEFVVVSEDAHSFCHDRARTV